IPEKEMKLAREYLKDKEKGAPYLAEAKQSLEKQIDELLGLKEKIVFSGSTRAIDKETDEFNQKGYFQKKSSDTHFKELAERKKWIFNNFVYNNPDKKVSDDTSNKLNAMEKKLAGALSKYNMSPKEQWKIVADWQVKITLVRRQVKEFVEKYAKDPTKKYRFL